MDSCAGATVCTGLPTAIGEGAWSERSALCTCARYNPCTAPEAAEPHITASGVVPQSVDVDLNELSGRGPMCRALNASKFMALQGVTGLWGTGRACGRWVASWCCCGGARHSRRVSRPGEEEGRTPRHDLSETESEEEDNPCQADAIAWKECTQAKRLSKERCKDAACSWVKLLSDDGVQSSSGELHWDGLQASCQLCARHQESYALSKTRRACSVEGCEKVAQTVKGGVKLCRLHASKEERGPAVKPGNFASRSRGLPEARKRSISRGAERARPHSQDATPKRSTQTEAAELRGISSPPRLDGATSAASLPGVDASVEDQVLSGLTWEEIAGIPDEDLRKRAIFLKQKGTMPGPTSSGPSRSTPRTEEPDENQALFAYLEARLQGKGHDSAVEVSAVGGRTPSERQQRLRDLARRHCLRLTSELPAEAGKFVWELAQPQASPEEQPGGHKGFPSGSLYNDAEERGKLASIGRLEERLVFLLRGCDTLSVTLCPGVVGKELFHALRIAGTQARPQLRKIEFPCNIQNRHSYGFAALQMGGKTLSTLPEYCLSAGDFPLTSEEDFDNYGGSPDLKLERKGRYPNTLTSWFRAALRQSWAFACLFGEEYYPVLEKAASHLLRLGEQHGYAWPASAVYGAWEELWARFCEEARELDRRIRRAMQDETPTFARLKFFALSPGPDGQPWLQLPGTFRLDDDTQNFCTDMLPRMQRQLSRACWAGAQKKSSAGGRAAGEGDNTEARTEPGAPLPSKGGRAGGEAADKAAPPKLLGPSLTPKEAARSLDHRPKDQQGCPEVPKWTMLDYTVQLQLLRRGGLKGAKARTADEVDREFTRVRAEQAAKTAAAKQEGIAAAKAKASATQRTGQAASASNADRTSRAGQRVPEPAGHVVADLDDVLPTDREETPWSAMQAVDAADPTGLVGVYLRNRLLRLREETGRAPELDDVTQLLEEAVSLGGPELSEEAAHLLEERGFHRKAGESPLVQLSGLTWNSSIGAGTLTWKGVGHWAMYDYQAEADVRVFHHDLLHFGHDRDYRTLVAHPLEVVCGSRYSGKAEDTRWVLVGGAGAFGLQVLRAGRGHPVEARTGPALGAAAPAAPNSSADWPLLSWLPAAGQPLSLLVLGLPSAHASVDCASGPLPDAAAAVARSAPSEGDTQALGEVALAEPEAIALKVDPDTLTAEIGKLSLEDEDPDWSGDEAEIQVTTALPGEAASSSSKQEEGVGTKKEIEHDETEEPAPRRRKVVLATGQLSLLRALAAANASNWSGVQRALREAQGSGEEKSELVENLTSLAQAFSKNRDACAQAATSRAAALAELEGAEAAYFAVAALPPALAELERKNPVRPSMNRSLGWIDHARFLQDKEAAGVWVARRKEKSRLRAAAHRAAQQVAEGAGAGAQDPVRDQADAASHLNFQMNEAAKDSLRRFQEELRSGELDTPMRAAVAQKRKPESERRRRIKWAKFCEKQGKTRKYDPTESEQNHPYAHSESLHLERAMPWPASGPAGCLYLAWRMTLGWGVETKEVACQTTQGHPPAADHVRVTPAGECFHAEHCGHLRVTLGSLAVLALLVLQGCDRNAGETERPGDPAGPPLLGASALVVLLFTWPGLPWRAPRPASRRVGEGTRRVRFAVREAHRETRGEPLPAQTSSLTTRHHRRRGSHPLVAPSGNSPSETKRKFREEGPEPGVVPARRWAQERLQLVKDHLSPATQRLYDGHWRWWELYTRRRGVSALRSVDCFDPGEESLFLDYLVYLFVGQGLAAATAQARLGAIRSVHLQLGFPDPLKPLPRLQLALEGIRRRKGPITKRRPVTPHMLARAQAALPQGLWGRQLNCALQLGFFFLLRVSELVGGNNPKLGLRVKDVKLYSRGEFLARPPFRGADEVQIVVRASKTDPEGESATRNLFRSDAAVCPVLATIEFLELRWSEATPHPEEKFFGELTRQDIQTALQTIAASLGEEAQAYTPHSLRFGGASAMWAGGMDSYVLRTWGRWNSDAFLAYLWTSRKASANTAACMARADMTPVKGFPNK
ncbi:unnamed protein product [Symbiodinium sp. CCMP2592]|nr:unnamed protein product [Symbiodinium sp. CCMP2592]